MKRVRVMLILATAVVLALPAVASADPNPTRLSVSPSATYSWPQQINLEIGVSCQAGLYYNAWASVMQQQGLFTQIWGNGFVTGPCTGGHQKVAIPVYAGSFPGWQLGDALANVTVCAFSCDSKAREIRIGL